ncbi:MAG: carbohydrate porin [Phycisphaerae bacterium]|nr:carbohydrate porin [Phycisphaerae bacterium]
MARWQWPLMFVVVARVMAQDSGSGAGSDADAGQPSPGATTTQPVTASPAATPSLIQKLPDYSGDWWSRGYLTGDWGGARTELAENGILFDFGLTQIIQGNAHGGKDTHNAFRYSGSVDYTLRLDTARMKLWPGGLITLRGETQFGQSINSKAGSLGVANFDALLPIPDEGGKTTLSEFYITQALSEKLVIVAGKMDLTSGDANEFAHDERSQFLNSAFRINPVLFTAGPYTAMAVGVIALPTDWLTISTFVNDNDPEGAATKTGFNTAFHDRDWLSVAQEYTFKIRPFEKPGHQRFGWFWTSRDFVDFAGDPRLPLPGRVQSLGFARRGGIGSRGIRPIRLGNTVLRADGPDRRPDDWGLYYNFDQYLHTEADDATQGFGVFGRFGWSTGESNPVEQFYSLGVGGRGSIPTRDRDTWGIGYYHVNVSDDLPELLDMHSEQGVELYYNIEVTPWLHISPDVQVLIDPGAGFDDRDVALVYGLRAQMSF